MPQTAPKLAYRNSAYDAPANFRTRKLDKDRQGTNIKCPPSFGDCDDGYGNFMPETQERSYALNHSLLREVGQRGAHSNIDCLPIRNMSGDPVFAARPDRGTMYVLDHQLQPAYPFHPNSVMAYEPKPREDRGNFTEPKPFYIDTYGFQAPEYDRATGLMR